MKILYLQSTSEIGGSDISLLRIVEQLDGRRYRPVVAVPHEGPLLERFRGLGCEVVIVPEMLRLTSRRGPLYLARYLLNYPRAVGALVGLIRSRGVDLVHTNSLHNLYGFMAAFLAGRPHIWHAREIVTQSRWLRLAETFLAKRFSARVLVTSDAVAAMFGSPPGNMRKIPDTVDIDRFHPDVDGSAVREELGAAPDAPLIGMACRLDRAKGIDVFLSAASLCHKYYPSARFVVVGGEIEGQEAYADELRGLAGEVRFTGWRYGPDDMPAVHAALDVLVVASRRPEGFGLSALEAMSSGKPVVATRHGGSLELCVERGTALLVPPDDARALADALMDLLGEPGRARAMGAEGRRRAASHFESGLGARALEAVYQEAA